MNVIRMADRADGIGMSDNADLAEWLQAEAADMTDGGFGEVATVSLVVTDKAGRMSLRCQGTVQMDSFKQVGIYQAAIHKALGECDL